MKMVLRMDNLCCANCAAKIEARCNKIDGVKTAELAFITGRMTVEYDGDASAIVDECSRIARKIEDKVTVTRVG